MMQSKHRKLNFISSFRGQLILGIAIVLAITTSVFVVIITVQQKSLIIEHQNELDIGLSKTLSLSSRFWLVSNDLAGLQDLVISLLEYPEVNYAILTDENGHILAHTDRQKIGKYLIDFNETLQPRVISQSDELIEVIVPIMFVGKHVGWARIGLDHSYEEGKINQMIRTGLFYVLAELFIGTFIAFWVGNRITSSLYVVQKTMNEVADGDTMARSFVKGNNEVALLAREFNLMLDALTEREDKIKNIEFRFEKLFNLAGVPLCIIRLDENKITFNNRFLKPFGYDIEEITTVDYWFLKAFPNLEYRKTQTEEWKNAINIALKKNYEIENLISTIYCKSGELRTVTFSGLIVNNEVIVTYFDLTELKKTEHLLSQNLRFTESLLMAMPIPVFVKGVDGSYKNCNNAFTIHTGYTAQYIAGKMASELWPPELAEFFHQKDLEILEKLENLTFEAKILDKDKKWKDAIYFKNLFYNENGKPAGIIGAYIDISDRKKGEKELKQSQNLLKSSLESPKDMIIFSIDKDYNYMYFNDYHKYVVLSAYGIELNDGMNMLECMGSDEDREKSIANFEIAFRGESFTSVEEYGTNESSYFETRYNPIFNDKKEVIGATAFSLNITKRILDEKKVKESNAYLENIINSANTLIVLCDNQFQITKFNPYIENLTGFTEDEVIGKGIEIIFTPQNKTKAIEILHKSQTGEKLEGIELEILNKDNTRSTILWNMATIFEDDSITPMATIVQGQDITERKLAEESLKLSEEKYRMLSENFAGGISIYEDNKLKYISDGYVKIFGYDKKELENISFEKLCSFFHKDDVERVLKTIQTAYEEQAKQIQYSLRLQNKQGNFIWIEDNVHVEYDNQGNHLKSTFYSRDITERKKAEEKIHQLNEELELRVNERTKQLETANKQLAIENAENAKRAVELDSINKELETFSYSVSHDLRAPLRHIIGFGDLLTIELENKLSDNGQHYLSVIIDAAKKMGILIDDLLNFSKTSRIELRKTPIDMNQIIDVAKNQLQYPLDTSKIEWRISKLPIVLGDYNLLLLVWVNLLDNALKYSSKREEIFVEINFEENLNETIFSVSDNGVGFDMQYASKLFGLFQRLHSSSEFEGTGIGLANVQRIINNHGGRTWAKSEVDKGATFYFSLPKY